ncbi:FxSxx-COOH system tetratricopeptide repeat protein, partial [Streptomyces sp. NPDC060005]|uniref:FxSxx-COOH system tetratricopeptide repeat protein n=1 Tax=Streptomyces sp. NPDC060005 TaxID=3347034 RepID=UPI0036D0A254
MESDYTRQHLFSGQRSASDQGDVPAVHRGLPHVWSIPARNAAFVGRGSLIADLRARLSSEQKFAAQALHGQGGVGKSQLAIEYAYRFADCYDLVWWIASGHKELIGKQLAALAEAAGLIDATASTQQAVSALKNRLRQSGRWLLIFDNVQTPEDIMPWIPQGPGHLLITSRDLRWWEVAMPMEIDIFTRAESRALLRQHLSHMNSSGVDELAEGLGDLPLALAQAVGLISETGISAKDYLAELSVRAGSILSVGLPPSYPLTLAAAIKVSTDRLEREDEIAAQLALMCAQLDSSPVSLKWFLPSVLTERTAVKGHGFLALSRAAGLLGRLGLVRITQDGPHMHPLVQAVLRDQMSSARRVLVRRQIERLLVDADPKEPENSTTWPIWARLLPHILAADPATSPDPDLRRVACDAVWYLLSRGNALSARDISAHQMLQWRASLGLEDEHTARATHNLARAWRDLGQYEEARRLHATLLERNREVLGEDHPITLGSASSLAIDLRRLGRLTAAKELDEHTLEHRRRIYGDDHPVTMASVTNLAADLRELGEVETARQLDEETLAKRRRTHGYDHPATLGSANNLAVDLAELGETGASRALNEDTLARRQRTLGPDHPATLDSAHNLAVDLRELGEVETARQLDEETLAKRRRTHGYDHPATLRSANNLAVDLAELGETGASRALNEDTLARRQRT